MASSTPGRDMFAQRPLAPDPAAPIPAAFVRTLTCHPLLYRKRIERVEKARPGDLVAVYGPGDRLLGYGLYNPRSEIAVRMVFYGEICPTTPPGSSGSTRRSGCAATCCAWTT